MPLLACKCPSCHADVDFDESMDFMFCKYCGTKVIKEDVVNITNNISIADGYQIHDADWYYNSVMQLYLQRRWYDGHEIRKEFFKNYPLDNRIEELRGFQDKNDIHFFGSSSPYDDRGRFCLRIADRESRYFYNDKNFDSYIQNEFPKILENCHPSFKKQIEEEINKLINAHKEYLQSIQKEEELKKARELEKRAEQESLDRFWKNLIIVIIIALLVYSFIIMPLIERFY